MNNLNKLQVQLDNIKNRYNSELKTNMFNSNYIHTCLNTKYLLDNQRVIKNAYRDLLLEILNEKDCPNKEKYLEVYRNIEKCINDSPQSTLMM